MKDEENPFFRGLLIALTLCVVLWAGVIVFCAYMWTTVL